MKKIAICLMLLISLPVANGCLRPGNRNETDAEKIKVTLTDYAKGWYSADAKRMERALHPDLAKRILLTDQKSGKSKLEHTDAMSLIQATRKNKTNSTGDQRIEISLLDFEGVEASVKLVMDDWIDYIHLSNVDGQWKIVNVLWELAPESKTEIEKLDSCQ